MPGLKKLDIQNLLWIALVLALAGSLNHLAVVFASVDGNKLLGWLQAIAVDTGLFTLSYSLRRRKQEGKNITHTWLGIVMFTGISIYGNLAYGILSLTGQLPFWIIVSKPYVLAASLPALVLYLAEQLAEDKTKTLPETKAKIAPVKKPKLATKKLPKQDKISQRQKEVLTLAGQNLTNQQIADRLKVSVGTVKNDRKELNGQMER